MEENKIGKIVVDAAVKVPSALGPGLLPQTKGTQTWLSPEIWSFSDEGWNEAYD